MPSCLIQMTLNIVHVVFCVFLTIPELSSCEVRAEFSYKQTIVYQEQNCRKNGKFKKKWAFGLE